ncbi:hypothetical protein NQ314_020002 [Rhamnusium bicolor]|uniref:Uncharacterized protein n=1 Tax=Rhamnusium bicolor TaxID=1586634 RepID=A0AAV8WMY9_9CUCU|nr:hypothetical protein NQ314_020002 [Rhamnusium bicolor]
MVYLEKKLIKILHNFTNKIIKIKSRNFENFDVSCNEEFNYSKRKKLVMLDLLLKEKISDGLIDDRGIQDEVNTFMFAVKILNLYVINIVCSCSTIACIML